MNHEVTLVVVKSVSRNTNRISVWVIRNTKLHRLSSAKQDYSIISIIYIVLSGITYVLCICVVLSLFRYRMERFLLSSKKKKQQRDHMTDTNDIVINTFLRITLHLFLTCFQIMMHKQWHPYLHSRNKLILVYDTKVKP